MDPAIRETLRTAYHLIQAGDKDAARALIKPVLAVDRENIDAWWLAAHAASNTPDQRLALRQVLLLDPTHGPARKMLDTLHSQTPGFMDEIARQLENPPGTRRRSPSQRDLPLVRNRWVWNIVLAFGCVSFLFGSMALVSGFLGLTTLNDAVGDVGDALGLREHSGDQGEFGTIQGGDPYAPYEIPITRRKGATLGSESPNVDQLDEDEAHIYTFSGSRGQEVVALLQFTVAGDARYVMELRDINDRRVARGVGDTNSGTITLVHELTATSQYALVLIGRPGGPRGDYFLGVELLN